MCWVNSVGNAHYTFAYLLLIFGVLILCGVIVVFYYCVGMRLFIVFVWWGFAVIDFVVYYVCCLGLVVFAVLVSGFVCLWWRIIVSVG